MGYGAREPRPKKHLRLVKGVNKPNMSTNITTHLLPEKTKNRLKSLLAAVQVANEVLAGAQVAAQKYADKFNSASESALESFDLTPQQEGLSIDWDTGIITVKTEVPDQPSAEVPELPPESA